MRKVKEFAERGVFTLNYRAKSSLSSRATLPPLSTLVRGLDNGATARPLVGTRLADGGESRPGGGGVVSHLPEPG